MSDIAAAATALGDQVQQVCTNAQVEVVGFCIIIAKPDMAGSVTEVRTRIPREDFERLLRMAGGGEG